jgi:hypothetical protein
MINDQSTRARIVKIGFHRRKDYLPSLIQCLSPENKEEA